MRPHSCTPSRLPGVLTLSGLVCIAFVFSRATEDSFHALRWTLLAGVAAAGWLAMGLRRHPWPPEVFPFRLGLPLLLITGFLVCTGLSLVSARNLWEGGWQAVQSFVWCAWLLLMLAAGAQSGSASRFSFPWERVRTIALVTAVAGALIAIGQYWGLWFPLKAIANGPGGLYGNRNLLASGQFLLCPWVLWALLAGKGVERVVAWAAWCLFGYVLAITQCRAVWLGCAAAAGSAAIISLLVSARRKEGVTPSLSGDVPRGRRASPYLLAMGMAGGLAAGFAMHAAVKPVWDHRAGGWERAATLVEPGFNSNGQRLALWKKTAQLIVRNPVLGVGAGNWKIALPGTGMAGLLWPDMEVVEVRPYNDWLWTFSEIGIPGGLCWLGLWLAGIAAGLRTLGRRGNADRFLPALALTSGLIGFGVISACDFPRERAEHMAWYAAMLAALFLLARETGGAAHAADPDVMNGAKSDAGLEAKSTSRFLFSPIAAALSVACASAAIFSGLRWKNETLVQAVLDAHRGRDWIAVDSLCGRVDERICNLTRAAGPLAWHQGIARFQLGDRTGAEESFRRALRFHPFHTHAIYNLAVCRLADGDTAEAELGFRTALGISPGFREAAYNAAVLALRRGERAEARRALDGVAVLKRDGNWRRLDRELFRAERKSQ